MKKYLVAFSATFILLLASCGPTQDDAVKYNNKLVDLSDKVDDLTNSLADQLDGHNVDSLNKLYTNFVAVIKNGLAEVKQMKPLEEKDPAYYNAMLAHFENMDKLAQNEVKRIVAITTKFGSGAEPTDEEYAALEKDIETFDNSSQQSMDRVKTEQKKFSTRWNIILM
jgi:peptidoglycan hydrolase CwlO-like protein